MLVTYIEVCNNTEIRFLRQGDFQFIIEGEKNVTKFMIALKDYSLFDDTETHDLREYGLEFFHSEHDFADTLNLLDRLNINVLKKHSEQIN